MTDVSSPNTWRQADEVQMYHLIELVSEGDEIKVNQRKRPLSVTEVFDSEHNRVLTLEGNGTRYSLIMDRYEGEPTGARLQFPSGWEQVGHLKVANRNAIHPRIHDHLMSEEIPSEAPREYREGVSGYVERTERTVSADGMKAVKWAVKAFVDYYREDGRMGDGPTALEYYQDALAMWERIRGWDDEWTFYGAEMGLIGAYLDYAIEDLSIRDRIPEDVVGVIESVRNREDIPEGLDLPDINGEDEDDSDGEDSRLMADGSGVIPEPPVEIRDTIREVDGTITDINPDVEMEAGYTTDRVAIEWHGYGTEVTYLDFVSGWLESGLLEFREDPEVVTDGGPVTAEELMDVFGYTPGEPPNPIHGEITGEGDRYGHPWVFIGQSYQSQKRWKQKLDREGYEYHHPEDGRYDDNVKDDTVVVTGRVDG